MFTGLKERLTGSINIESDNPKTWSNDTWLEKHKFDSEFMFQYNTAGWVLDYYRISERMGLVDENSSELLLRLLTLKFLQTDQVKQTCDGCKKITQNLIADTQNDIEIFETRNFQENQSLVNRISGSVNFLYFLGTQNSTKRFGLPADSLKLWCSQYEVRSN
jgi:hypothetical protein